MGAVLVHAQGAGQGAAADEGDPGQLKEPLKGAVLPVAAVDQGEGPVKGQGPAGAVQQEQGGPAPVQPQGAGEAGGLLLPAVLRNGLQRSAVPAPGPLLGDAHRDGLIQAPVHMGEHPIGGGQRDAVLGGTPAEQHQDLFHVLSTPSVWGRGQTRKKRVPLR